MQALGCLLYYLLFSKLAFNPDAKLQILNGEFTVAGNRPPALVALLRELLVVAPARRPGESCMCTHSGISHASVQHAWDRGRAGGDWGTSAGMPHAA